jgi:uncharacterized membrane protein
MSEVLKGIESILEVIDRFPQWMQVTLLSLVGVVLILFLIMHILKTLADPELANSARVLGGFFRRGMVFILRAIFAPLESPIERPRTKFAFACLSVVHSYLSAVVFFCMLLVFGFIYFVSRADMSVMQNITALGVLLVLFYFMVFFRTETDRDYLRVKELWVNRASWWTNEEKEI